MTSTMQLPRAKPWPVVHYLMMMMIMMMIFGIHHTITTKTPNNRILFVHGAEFNLQVMKRVHERLNDFVRVPIDAARRANNFRTIGAFPNNMDTKDRDLVSQFFFMEKPTILYYGLEDGTFTIYSDQWNALSLREPGESGYDATNIPPDMEKYIHVCVNSTTGESKDCILDEVGQQYIKCNNECELIPCPDEESQGLAKNCTKDENGEMTVECISKIKWCKNYTVMEIMEGEENKYGFIPRAKSCINVMGQPEQRDGWVYLNDTTKEYGNCYFEDKKTPVNRTIPGAYEYCQKDRRGIICSASGVDLSDNPFAILPNNDDNKVVCSDTYIGSYQTTHYDPRFRGWYILTKDTQKSVWSDPYPFFGENDIGITYSEPIFTQVANKKVFKGVLAVDYYLRELNEFLVSQYNDTEMEVMVIEQKEPYYVIASSTGSSPTKNILKSDPTKPCPYADITNPECDVARVPLDELAGDSMDEVMRRAFYAHKDANFEEDKLLSIKESDIIGSKAFVAQWEHYDQEESENLQWHLIVVMPMERSTSEAVLPGNISFVTVCIIGSLGFIGCLTLLVIFFGKRHEKAIIHADWRFTCAFILGCTALNLSTFTLLGANTNPNCMLRMWSLNALFVSALSPLYVKVWRMYKLLKASSGFQRVNVTHVQAVLYTLPLIMVEVVILTIFSFVDPPRQSEELGVGDGFGMQQITCEQDTQSFFLTQLIFDALLVCTGCVLAYQTRDLDPKFGEAKQLAFSMYNIAFTGLVVVLIVKLVDLDQVSKIILQAIGVLWGSFFCSLSFVLPRLLEAAKDKRGIHGNKSMKHTQSGHGMMLVSTSSENESGRFSGRFSGINFADLIKPSLIAESSHSNPGRILPSDVSNASEDQNSEPFALKDKDAVDCPMIPESTPEEMLPNRFSAPPRPDLVANAFSARVLNANGTLKSSDPSDEREKVGMKIDMIIGEIKRSISQEEDSDDSFY